MPIHYTDSLADVTPEMLPGFFVDWPSPPSPPKHLEMLAASDAVELAVDDATGRVVGFVTALTDHRWVLFVSFLEVLPPYRHRGIATALVRRLFDRFGNVYSIALQCDEDLRPFYERLGMRPSSGMSVWRHDRQAGH